LWNAQSDNAFLGTYNGGSALFDNFGTFRKSGNSGVTTLDAGVEFNNTGLVQVENGTLAISGATSSGGDFAAAGGGIINFSGCLFTNTTTFTGPGSFLTGDTTFGGTLAGTLNWEGNNGHLIGNLTVASNSVLNIVFGGGLAMFRGCVLTNYGTVNWADTDIHGVDGYNEQIYNYGLWNAQSDNTFAAAYNGGSALFDNFGTFRKSGNTGVTALNGGTFNNTGILDAQSGNIALQGAYTLANGTKMSFGLGSPAGNGSISLSGAASFAGSLSVNLNNFFWPVVGNSFNLLNYTSESGLLFTNTTLPAFITWQTNYNPSVFTLAVVARQTNTAPANLTMTTLNNTNLSLQWPGDHTGWRIQAQTNPVTVGLSKNWATLAGSSLTNQFIMPIGKTNGAVFFRMIYP
jgi:hypothetical protein